MPYNKPAPQWNAVGTEPPQSLKDNGWQFNQKPPADYFNWFFYNTTQAIIELQLEALNTEQKGSANGLATLGADSKLTASQLPAIGSSQITDNSITNTDLATDIKVGSLTTLTTTVKSTVVAAINEVKSSADAKIPNSEKGAASGVATLGADSKLTASQLPAIGSGQITDGSITNTDLATDVKVGSLTTLKTANKASVTVAVNEVHDDFDAHNSDTTKHITAQERSNWDAKAGTAVATQTTNGLQSAADKTALDNAQKFKLTADNGRAKDTAPADLDIITTSGTVYTTTSTLNKPIGVGFAIVETYFGDSVNGIQRLTSLTNNSVYTRIRTGSGWKPWQRLADGSNLGSSIMGNKFTDQSLATFIGKAAGSTTANPHYAGSRLAVGLGTPLQSWLEYIQSNYNSLVAIDGATITHTTSANGEQAQQRYSFNVLEHILRTYGTIPGATMAEKVAWANANIARMAFNWWGNGASPTGNKATVSVFLADTGNYAGANIAHTNSGVNKLIYGFTQIINKIDANGFVHFIAYAEPSNGTAASVINTDYAELEVELSTDIKTNLSYSMKPSWIDAVLQNGWVEFSTVSRPQYSQGLDGFVTLKGGIKSGALNTTLMTLPLGFRPVKPSYYLVPGNDTSKSSFRIAVLQDGQVNVLNFSGTSNSDFISLDGIRFPTN